MNQTRTEVLSLLKQFDQEFTVFDGAEESFILDLVRGSLSNKEQSHIDWKRLSKATFVLPHCYCEIRKRSIAGVPEWFLQQAKATYLHQIAANESRILQIQELARLFENANIKVIFVKGAAELAYSPDDMDFFGRRYMCDIDLLCATEDLPRVDELVRTSGYGLWDHGLKHWSREQICDYTLSQFSHYIYNAFSKTYMEVHGFVAVGANRASYPPNFEKLLLDQSRKIDVRGTAVWVPKPEHLLVYSLCHAASKNNNQGLVYLDQFYLDEFAGTNCVISPPVLVNRRLDICQLRFLLQIKDLLLRFGDYLDFLEIKELLLQVAEKDLSEMYVFVASHIFNERFPIAPGVSLEMIKMARQRYVSRFMLPLLAERIESIISNRLDQMTAKYIEQQVERIAVSIEKRVVHQVTLSMINNAKSFIRRRIGKVLSKPNLLASKNKHIKSHASANPINNR